MPVSCWPAGPRPTISPANKPQATDGADLAIGRSICYKLRRDRGALRGFPAPPFRFVVHKATAMQHVWTISRGQIVNIALT